MSEQPTQPIAGPPQPGGLTWWQKPVVAVATVVLVTGVTGGVAWAATRGDSPGGTTQERSGVPGGGQFGPGPVGRAPDGGQRGQTSRGAPTT